ncbi:MAG: copper resistance protein NlpE N-terminal domain-containing protein [Rikenellaceae bacterium]|nr:copper resistance protein NlpE N-terminal domain-containing protein [Rikenellaceae bacterium]
MNKIILAALSTVILAACINRRAAVPETEREYSVPEDVTDMAENDIVRAGEAHTAENSLDFTGTYRGILPCADCSGIETVLIINNDGTYRLSSRYIDRNNDHYTCEGKYSWLDDGTQIRLDDGNEAGNRYFIAEGRIFVLDRDGNRIQGPMRRIIYSQKNRPNTAHKKSGEFRRTLS